MSAPFSDRNLLLGILALQMDFITRDALIEALHRWTLEKSRSLSEILEACGALAPEDRIALDQMVDRHIARHGGDARQSLSSLDLHQPTKSVFEPIADPDIQQSLSSLSSVVTRRILEVRSDETESWGHLPPEADGRFRILRLHDQGGLGVVYLARDTEVNREVALKQLNESIAADPQSRARFVFEAEITGNLEHPGIVPVYGMGQDALGRPYYAMRFVRGETFKEAVDHFHRDATLRSDPATRQREFQKLLRRFLAVCETMEYAHNRGIIHRDLKPRNILLGPYGETLVVDWGLAKVVGHGASEPPSDATLRPPSSSEIEPTVAGSLLGTAAFMSPEQARGEVAGLGPLTDIYGLGATLYYFLTGRAPFDDPDRMEVIRKVQAGEFPTPREVRSTVDRALDAVCRKAMARLPEDRYASARRLAEDIERWLVDQPVGAYQEGRAARVARWLRHHRSWAKAGAAALVLITAVSSAASLVVERARRFERRARKQEATATAEASNNFAMARDAVNRLLSELGKGRLGALPEDVRWRLAADAAEFNERFLRMGRNDPALRRDAARVFVEVGNINRMLGRVTDAVAAYARSVALLEQLARDFPNEPKFRDQLAETLREAADLLQRDGQPASAEQFCRKGLALADRLLDQAPQSTVFRRTKATCLDALAEILVDMGRYTDAVDAGQQALSIWVPIAQADGATYLDEIILGVFLKDQGRALHHAGNTREAESQLLQAIERLRVLVDGPLVPTKLGKLAGDVVRANAAFIFRLAQIELGLALSSEEGRRSDARRSLDAAVDGLKALGANKSPNAGNRKALALALLARGSLGLTPAEAQADWGEARQLLEKLAAESPHTAAYHGPLAMALGRLGRLALDQGNRTAARKLLEQAVQHERRALEANSDGLAGRENLDRLLKDLDSVAGSAQD